MDLGAYIGNKIRYYRNENKMTQDDLAKKLGLGKGTISNYESGYRTPQESRLFELAEVLGVSINDLFPPTTNEDEGIKRIYNKLEPSRQKKVYNFAKRQLHEQENKVVPLVGATAANPQVLSYADPVYDTTVNASVPNNADCALVIHGDSMETEYKDGSIVCYKRQESVENGELAIVDIDGDGVTFKKVIFDYDNQQVILRSLNATYDDRGLKNEEYKIVGKGVK